MSLVRAAVLGAGLAALGGAAAVATPSPNSNHDRVWQFTGKLDGANPRGDVLIDSAFRMYGTSPDGVGAVNGSVWMVTPQANAKTPGTMTPIYQFTGGADGSFPSAGLIADAKGALYGTAALDGVGNGGTVFRLVPPAKGMTAWTETTLWSFGGAGDGKTPVGNLVFDASGNLYGTTNFGGAAGFGAVFKLTPPAGGTGAWTETVLWSFTGGADGAYPVAALVLDANGALYGTAKAGGPANVGSVFQLVPPGTPGGAWTENTLWTFTGGTDGSSPSGTLLPDGVGGFYGTTQFGGPANPSCNQPRFPYYHQPLSETAYAANADYIPAGGNACGLVFDISPPTGGGAAWTLKTIWNFDAGPDGANPVAGLVADSLGDLYLLATEYGPVHNGAEVELLPPHKKSNPWREKTVTAFAGQKQGFFPRGTLSFGLDGRLYGTTQFGGDTWEHVTNFGYGVLFTSTP